MDSNIVFVVVILVGIIGIAHYVLRKTMKPLSSIQIEKMEETGAIGRTEHKDESGGGAELKPLVSEAEHKDTFIKYSYPAKTTSYEFSQEEAKGMINVLNWALTDDAPTRRERELIHNLIDRITLGLIRRGSL